MGLPAVAVAGPLLVIARSDEATIVVLADAELLAGLGSGSVATTVAVLLIGPAAAGRCRCGDADRDRGAGPRCERADVAGHGVAGDGAAGAGRGRGHPCGQGVGDRDAGGRA